MSAGSGRRYAGQAVLVVGMGRSGAASARYLEREGALLTLTDSRNAPPDADYFRSQFRQQKLFFGELGADLPLAQFAFAVVSPGVPINDPFVVRLQAEGVPVLGDIELFARAAEAPVIGITGSNGKSTVTTLVGEMAQAAGLDVGVGGNLGTPALDLLDKGRELYVLELSSFQLETTSSLRLVAATMLNISPDHLDRHGSLAAYVAAKARIYSHALTAIVNRDDLATLTGAHTARQVVSFGLDLPAEPHYGVIDDEEAVWLARGETKLEPLSGLKVEGLHNVANALAALALADAAGIPRKASLQALRQFRGLPHRCEWVADIGGVSWINDSKGTNVGATLAALEGLSGPLLWLGGGQGKGQDFSALRTPLAKKAQLAILYGQDAAQIERDLAHCIPVRRVVGLGEAVVEAHRAGRPGDRVLLSPACASLDQFRNFEDRGVTFRNLVHALPDPRKGASA